MKKLIFIMMILFLCAFSYNSAVKVYLRIIKANNIINAPIFYYTKEKEVNAYSERDVFKNIIVIHTGMLKGVRNIDELAFVLGHELAHSKLRHSSSSYASEYAADRLGASYARRAGYNMCRGSKIVLRFYGGDTHPEGQDRYNRIKCK